MSLEKVKVITTHNAGLCSAFELRLVILIWPLNGNENIQHIYLLFRLTILYLTIFDWLLRQELLRRGAFDLDEDKVNFKSLLQRLMVELVAEEKQAVSHHTETVCQEADLERQRLKKERERKKQEALERSRLRQADPEYFRNRSELNAKASGSGELQNFSSNPSANLVARDASATVEVGQGKAGGGGGGGEEEEVEGETANQEDPFRCYKPKVRSKIYVK